MVVRIPSVDRFRANYLKDLSDGGLFIKAPKTLPVGAFIMLELWPPGWSEPAQISAKVVRAVEAAKATADSPAGMAVRFVSVPPEIERRLEELVRELGGDPDDAGEAPEEGAGAAGEPPSASVAQIEALVAELDLLRERSSSLENELIESRGQIQALSDHAAALGEARDELDAAREKLSALEGQLEALRSELAAEKRAAAAAREEAKAARAEVKAAREEAKAVRTEADRLSAELQKNQARDGELQRLLSKAGIKGAGKGPPPPRPPPPKRELARDRDEEEEEVIVEDLDAAPAKADEEPDGGEELSIDADADEALDEEVKIEGNDSGLELGLDDLDLGSEDDEAGAKPLDAGEADEAAGPAFDEFVRRLGPKTRLIGTDGLWQHRPVEEDEATIADLVGASPTFATLLAQIGDRIAEDRIRKLLFGLKSKELIELR